MAPFGELGEIYSAGELCDIIIIQWLDILSRCSWH